MRPGKMGLLCSPLMRLQCTWDGFYILKGRQGKSGSQVCLGFVLIFRYIVVGNVCL